jgi:hypothetical protein
MTEQEPVPVELEVTEVSTIPPNRPRKVSASMWGPPEIGVVAVGALALLAALTAYFFFVIPSNRELARNRSEADRLEAELMSANSKFGEINDSQSQVDRIVMSMDDFETRFLPAISNGQAALYQRLNALFMAYGIVNTNGPDYNPLDTVDQADQQQSEEEKGRSKFRSLYPGVYVSMTLEGPYSNLRRFIREIETGNEFIIISAIELAPSETEVKKPAEQTAQGPGAMSAPQMGMPQNPNFPRGGNPSGFGNPNVQSQQLQPRRPQGKMHGELVSLRIEMAAYFRRPDFEPLTIAPGQEQ